MGGTRGSITERQKVIMLDFLSTPLFLLAALVEANICGVAF